MEQKDSLDQEDPKPAARPDYEPPRLRDVGAVADLTRGAFGASDGLGPGSALG